MTHNPSATNWGIHVLRAVMGAVFGLAVMIPLLRYAGPFLVHGGTGAIALSGVGVIYLMMGLMVGLGTLMPGPGSKLLNVAGPDDLTDQRRVLLGSAASSLFIGAGLLALSLAGPAGLVPDGLALGTLALAFVLCVVIGLRQWSEYDELMRQMTTECGSIAFMIALPGLGGWAALAHLGRAAPFTPLWVLAALMFVLLISSFIAAGRRGLLVQDPD
jgi:hypothetical protein